VAVNDPLEPGPRPRGVRLRPRRPVSEGRGGVVADAAIGAGVVLARIIWLIVTLVALVIVLGIAFVVLKANAGNSIVSSVHDAAKLLVGPFDRIFKPKDPRLAIAINWGIAVAVYLFVARVIVRLLRR
jgi:ribose/xylose/arabinose/galactoside ABC-type transport system permease subunit